MMASVTYLASIHIALKCRYYKSVTLFLYTHAHTHELCILELKNNQEINSSLELLM